MPHELLLDDERIALCGTIVPEYVTAENVVTLVAEGDLVFLAVDNHKTRGLVDARCAALANVTLISGGKDGVEVDGPVDDRRTRTLPSGDPRGARSPADRALVRRARGRRRPPAPLHEPRLRVGDAERVLRARAWPGRLRGSVRRRDAESGRSRPTDAARRHDRGD